MRGELRRRIFYVMGAVLGGLIVVAFFGLGYHRKPNFSANSEVTAPGRGGVSVEPVSVVEGLAVYAVGDGPPVLLFPYPHGHTTVPMAQSPLAAVLVAGGRQVVTFDVPGAYRSTAAPDGTMAEMVRSADTTLARLGIEGPVDVVGHSMGGLAALAYAVERPERVGRLVLVNSVAGFPSAVRCGFPGSAFTPFQADYWRIIIWGMRVNGGRADLALHKRLYNLMGRASVYDARFFEPLEIEPGDADRGVPIRMIWSRNVYSRLSYAARLADVAAPTLVIGAIHDPQAGMACATELADGIPGARLVVFEASGHAPFVEEVERFAAEIGRFLDDATPR